MQSVLNKCPQTLGKENFMPTQPSTAFNCFVYPVSLTWVNFSKFPGTIQCWDCLSWLKSSRCHLKLTMIRFTNPCLIVEMLTYKSFGCTCEDEKNAQNRIFNTCSTTQLSSSHLTLYYTKWSWVNIINLLTKQIIIQLKNEIHFL